jgi:hypothetical protein
MLKKAVLCALATTPLLTGCLGHSALSAKARDVNLKLTENRWGREGIYLAFNFLYVYRISTFLDLIVFNSIEFWTGENPINGKSPLVDVPIEAAEQIGLNEIEDAKLERVSDTKAKIYLKFINGDKVTLDVTRDKDTYSVTMFGKEIYTGKITDYKI